MTLGIHYGSVQSKIKGLFDFGRGERGRTGYGFKKDRAVRLCIDHYFEVLFSPKDHAASVIGHLRSSERLRWP